MSFVRIEPGPWIPVSVPWCSTGHWRDVRIWLLDNVWGGNYQLLGSDDYRNTNRVVEFASEKDATLFALRWS